MALASIDSVRALLFFVVGVVTSSALWIYLDLQKTAAPRRAERPRPFESSGRPAPRMREQPATAATEPRGIRSRAPIVALDEPWAERPSVQEVAQDDVEDVQSVDLVVTRPEARTAGTSIHREYPKVIVAAGGGVEVPLTDASPGMGELIGVRVLIEPTPRVGAELALLMASGRGHAGVSAQASGRWYLYSDRGVRPYVSAGVGWRRFVEPAVTDVLVLPLGVGLAFHRGRWHADGRFALTATPGGNTHTAAVTAHVGLAF